MTLVLQTDTESTTLTSWAESGFHVKAIGPVSRDNDRSDIAIVLIIISNNLTIN